MNAAPSNEDYDIIVLGAGISGLAAAHILTKEGYRVIVLEARSRIGGRIHTVELDAVRSTGWPKVTVDLGANYLHGCSSEKSDQPLFHLARVLRITSSVCAGDEARNHFRGWEDPEVAVWRDHVSGERIPASEVADVMYLWDKTLVQAVALMRDDPHLEELTVEEVIEQALHILLGKFHDKGARKSTKLSSREDGIFKSIFSRFFAYVNPGSRLPARVLWSTNYASFIDTGEYDDPSCPLPAEKNSHLSTVLKKLFLSTDPVVEVAKTVSGPGEDRLVVSGFGKFIDFLAKTVKVKLNSVVRQVEIIDGANLLSDNEVRKQRVQVLDSEGNRFVADHCIISLPVGVLKGLDSRSSISFVPPLPQSKIDAINRVGIPFAGAKTHNKVILRFDKVFWDAEAPHLETTDPRLHILNLHLYGKQGVLCAHLWAGSGFEMTGKSDAKIVQVIMSILQGMYQHVSTPIPQPVQSIVTRWSEDPFSLGSYTCEEKGCLEGDRRMYAQSVPSRENPLLLFAGEATTLEDGAQQCSHGAFQSGIEAAKGVMYGRRYRLTLPKDKVVDYFIGRYRSKRRRIRHPGNEVKEKKSRITWTRIDRVTRSSSKCVSPSTPRSDGGSDSGIASSSGSSTKYDSVMKERRSRRRDDSVSHDSSFDIHTPCSDSGLSVCCEESLVVDSPDRLIENPKKCGGLTDVHLANNCPGTLDDTTIAHLELYQRSMSDNLIMH